MAQEDAEAKSQPSDAGEFSPGQVAGTEEEGKQRESISLTPKLIKSLMHRRVLKIASGGVHNICIVEPYPNSLAKDIHGKYSQNEHTDCVFTFPEEETKGPELSIRCHKFLVAARSP